MVSAAAPLDVIRATAFVNNAFWARSPKLTTPVTWFPGFADKAGYESAPEGRAAVCAVIEGTSETLWLTSIDFAVRIDAAAGIALTVTVPVSPISV